MMVRSLLLRLNLALACAIVALPVFAEQDNLSAPLTDKQHRLGVKFDRLEMLAGRLAELSSSTQPRRARLLREFVSKSREQDLSGRFAEVVLALEKGNLKSAVKGQGELQGDLEKLLELLLQEDRDNQIEAERKRIAKYLSELKRLIRQQRGVRARTEGGDDQQELTKDQQRTADATGSLSETIKETDGTKSLAESSEGKSSESGSAESSEQNPQAGEEQSANGDESDPQGSEGKPQQSDASSESQSKPGESSPSNSPSGSQSQQNQPSQPGQQSQQGEPGQQGQQSQQSQKGQQGQQGDQSPQQQPQNPADRAAERLQQAQQKMQEALEKLEEAKRSEATEAQQEALKQLEQAKAELEKILRQLREEEMERMLVLLEARFRKMLQLQIEVYERTQELDAAKSKMAQHELEIAGARLSRKELQIVREADRALVLLREDGTSVAFPEAIEQAREDMQAVSERLNLVKLSAITQAMEEDIIASLEEILAAIQQALEKVRQQSQQQQHQQGGQPGEKPLVDQLAELRMITALQKRINRRTELYDNMIEGDQALAEELLEALDELAQREERVYRATLDLHQGANR